MRKLLILSILTILPACFIDNKKTRTEITKRTSHIVKELDFNVQNKTQAPLYVTCFYYAVRETGSRWMWYKSPIYKLDPGKKTTIDIHTMLSKEDIKNVYGYLSVFSDEKSAKNSIYELLSDNQKIDLPRLVNLHNRIVNIETETYGFKGELLDWEFQKKHITTETKTPELDFYVENKTEKNLYVTGFIYQRNEYHPQWVFDKTPIVKINSGETKLIDVDTIISDKYRDDVIGYLAIFVESKKHIAEQSTFELLKPDQKISIGKLSQYKDHKVVIIPKRYGVLGGFDDRHPFAEYQKEKYTK